MSGSKIQAKVEDSHAKATEKKWANFDKTDEKAIKIELNT